MVCEWGAHLAESDVKGSAGAYRLAGRGACHVMGRHSGQW
jgi:hypothetical protein